MWLNEELKKNVRDVFEPVYNVSLSDDEVLEIAENLTGAIEAIAKFKWKQQYENATR